MKFSSIFVGALATLAAAAPAPAKEEERSLGGFGGAAGFGGFGAAAGLGIGSPLVGFGGGAIAGSLFNNAFIGGGFNNFALQNQHLAFFLGVNNFRFDTLFQLFDLGFGIENLVPLFNFPAGDFLNLEVLFIANQLFNFQWMFDNFGSLFFNGGFGGFNAAFVPIPQFGALDVAGISLLSQFAINPAAIIDVGAFNGLAGGFLGNAGFDLFNQFQFTNGGLFLKE